MWAPAYPMGSRGFLGIKATFWYILVLEESYTNQDTSPVSKYKWSSNVSCSTDQKQQIRMKETWQGMGFSRLWSVWFCFMQVISYGKSSSISIPCITFYSLIPIYLKILTSVRFNKLCFNSASMQNWYFQMITRECFAAIQYACLKIWIMHKNKMCSRHSCL